MKFAEHLSAHITPEWRTQYIQYEMMKDLLYEAQENAPTEEVAGTAVIQRYFAKFEEKFFVTCDKELAKINTFFSEKLAEAQRKFASLQSEMNQVTEHEEPIPTVRRRHSLLRRSRSKEKLIKTRTRTIQDLKLAFSEFYLSLILLQNYQSLNFTGFRKILKKHDKLMETDRGAAWRTEHVEVAPEMVLTYPRPKSLPVATLCVTHLNGRKEVLTARICGDVRVWTAVCRIADDIVGYQVVGIILLVTRWSGIFEDLLFNIQSEVDLSLFQAVVTSELEGGNRQRAMKRLRVPPLGEQQTPWTTFRVGLFSGIFLVLSLVVVLSAIFSRYDLKLWPAIRMYRGSFLIVFFLYLLGLNTWGWRKFGVNHVLIFEIDPRHHLSHSEILEVASFLGVMWSMSVLGYIYSDVLKIPSFVHPLALFRIFTAPFHPVNFADFWLADQLNSLVSVLLDFEYMVCYFIYEVEWHDNPNDKEVCTSWKYGIRSVVACLPAWFRFAQCLRRYRDTRHAFPHLVNAGKYSTSFFVIAFATLSRVHGEVTGETHSHTFYYLWICAAIISTCYTFSWDIKMDWGLLDRAAGENTLLREEIVYPKKLYYYLSAVQNFFLRFAWVMSISLGELGILHGELVGSLLAPLEVYRRFVWNFFRLENEHLNNCGEFRAVRDISVTPLNQDDQAMLEQMMDEEDGVTNRRKDRKPSDQNSNRRPSRSFFIHTPWSSIDEGTLVPDSMKVRASADLENRAEACMEGVTQNRIREETPTSTYAQSPALTEFMNHLIGLEKNKPIDWQSTLYFLLTGDLDPTCYNQAYTVHNDTILAKSYATLMIDSTGKLTPSGFFQGNWLELGNYRECTVDTRNAGDRPEDIEPMYCLVLWGGIPAEFNAYATYYTQGVCVPKSCSDRAVGNLTWTGFLGVKPMPSWFPIAVFCQREETYDTYSAGAVIALIIVSVMLGVLAVSTLYEFIITMRFSEEDRKYLTTSGVGRFCLSCSVYSNTKKLFNTYQPPGQLPALHGIRVISTLWIIYGHTDFFTLGNIEISNKLEKSQASDEWWFFIKGNMDMAVDTFLLLSGLLVTYLFMKQMKKTGGKFTCRDYGLHVLHRYWRLTPVYAFLILLFTCFTAYLGSGPWWALHDGWTMPGVRNCQTYWWANLLYLNNYGGSGCFGHGWYLAVDMQLYVSLAGVLVALYRKPKVGVVICCGGMASGVFLSGILYHFVVSEGGGDYVGTTYQWTFTRMAPYFMGMLLGYWLFKTNRKVPNTPNTTKLMLLGWVLGTACALVALVTPFRTPEANLLGNPAWRTFDRSLFSAGVAWVVYACCVGYGGIISEFLSWSGWLPLSRLTYTAYLVHPMIMQVYYMSYKGALLYSGINWWFLFVSFSFLAFVCGFAASMMAEVPFLELEKFILPTRRGRQGRDADREGRDKEGGGQEGKSESTAEESHDKTNPNLPLLHHGGYGTNGPTRTAGNGDADDTDRPTIRVTNTGDNITKSVNMESRSRKALNQTL
ncbi:hypothetical protein Bbelb_044830 [Branchiostoma belcheri]|nr:hypothetical protein Bbelb_044830 [Branchiostoma belcheri]